MTFAYGADRCKGRVPGMWHDSQCWRRAKRDGFCALHHPSAVAERRAKSEARFNERIDAERAIRNESARATVRAFLKAHAGDDLLGYVDAWNRE